MKRLNRTFFERDPVIVARELLGKIFVHETNQGKITGKIIETEAYGDATDRASHARFGVTKRNQIMHGPAGFLYVYSIYCIFYLSNIICQREGTPSAILIRAVEIIEGKDLACHNLSLSKFVKLDDKPATGPGKFSIAFQISLNDNGTDLITSNKLYLLDSTIQERFAIIEARRVGVEYAGESSKLPWRFYIANNPYVSKK